MADLAVNRLARFVSEDPLAPGPDTLAVLRNGVIDTLGCIISGSGSEVALNSRRAVTQMGISGSARVLGTSMRTGRPQAAFLNALAGHSQDFDDWEIPGNTHPSVVLVPALLAVADPGCSGMHFARAYLAGFEVIARLGEGMNFAHYDAGWHSTATLGAIGAAAACARLIGLSAPETAHALSLACSAATGHTCQFGSNAKPAQAGFAARAGVEAACLARAGMTGQAHVLDHPRGFAALMGGLNADQMDRALSRLGHGYALTEHGLVLKPWPSCGYTHRVMTCALSLAGKVPPADIARVDLHMPDFHAAILPFGQPRTRAEALFSAPFVLAMGLVHHGLTLGDLDRAAWADPEVAALIARTHVRPFAPQRPDMNYAPEDPDRVVITTSDGCRVEAQNVYPLGAPQNPMSAEAVRRKFEANIGQGPASRSSLERWVKHVQTWTDHDDVPSLFFEQG